MSCNCNKPKCDGKCGTSPSVLQINNPGDCTLFHRVEVPASMGDSKTNPPKNGDYRNVLLYYVADGTSWFFSSDGIPQKLVNGFTNYEDAINLPKINGETLIGDKSGAELGLQDKLIAGDNIQIAADGKTISATDTTYTAGDNIQISDQNVISATDTTYGPATDDEIGLVKPGDGLSVEADGTLNVDDPVPEDFFRGDATDSGCGATVELENMIGGSPASFQLKGNTAQAGTPTPSAPVAVQTVTGENVVKISDGQGNEQSYEVNLGKNLFDKDNASEVINAYIDISTHKITTGNNYRLAYIECEPNTTYTISKTLSARFIIATASDTPANNVSVSQDIAKNSDTTYTITTDSTAKYLCVFCYHASYDTLTPEQILATLQIEKGSQATSYAAYFTPIELCKIGSYQDYIYKSSGKWWLHKEIGKITFTSTTAWTKHSTTNGNVFMLDNTGFIGYGYGAGDAAPALMDTARVIELGSMPDSANGVFGININSQLRVFRGAYDASYTADTFKAEMVGHYVYGALATPTDTEITIPSLIGQLNAIKLASGLNYITPNGIQVVGEICVSGYADNWDGTIESIRDSIDEADRRIFRFNSVADMLGSDELMAGDMALTSGYYSPNDGGAGEYYIGATAYPTDSGSVMAMTNGLQALLIVENNTVNVKQFGAKGDGVTEDSIAIQNALKFRENNQLTIEFTDGGTYIVDRNFYIYSNTTVDLGGCTIKDIDGAPFNDSTNRVQFMNNLPSMKVAGYGALKNFVVKNGTLNGNSGGMSFLLFHGQDCRFENIDFLNAFASTHVFDLGGCKNITVKNCNFIGCLMSVAGNNYREVIQPDYATYSSLPYWGNDAEFAFDALPTDGLTVDGCVFKKNDSDTYYLNGVGTHSAGTAPLNNITVRNCEFFDHEYSDIRLPKANNIIIEDNIFHNINAGRTGDNFSINIKNEGNDGITALSGVVVRGNKFVTDIVDKNTSIFLCIMGRASYLTTNAIVENNDYTGVAVAENAYNGMDFMQASRVDSLIIRNNIIRRAKACAYIGSAADTPNLKFVNNVCDGCLRGIRAGSGGNVVKTIDSSNIWKTPVGEVDTGSARIVLKLASDYTVSDATATAHKLPLVVDKGYSLYINPSTNEFDIPQFFRKFRISGTLAVQTSNGGKVNWTRIGCYDRATSADDVTDANFYSEFTNDFHSIQLGESIQDFSDLAWWIISSADSLWKSGRCYSYITMTSIGDVTVRANGTYIVIEAY